MIPTAQPTPDFDVYVARPGTHWAAREDGEPLEAVYNAGFLPYSGTSGLQNVFYSARSTRVMLNDFMLTSENRRIAKKFDGRFTAERVADFKPDESCYDFCLRYFAKKHGPEAMPRSRLETIFDSHLITNTTIYRSAGQPVAYVLEVESDRMAHYWFSFYELAYAQQSLGLWLMLDAIRNAKARGLAYYYLGTVYGAHALYKTNFMPLEWWDGGGWSHDIARLKKITREE